jgi:hypothetical protein
MQAKGITRNFKDIVSLASRRSDENDTGRANSHSLRVDVFSRLVKAKERIIDHCSKTRLFFRAC